MCRLRKCAGWDQVLIPILFMVRLDRVEVCKKTAIRPTTSSDARNSKQAADRNRRGMAGLLIGGGGGGG